MAARKNQLRWFTRKRRRRQSSLTPHYRTYRPVAKRIIEHKVAEWATRMDLQYGRVTIRNQRGRWGSCSCKKNLNFNYRLIFLPEHLLDYIVVHELCHLRELNHSQRFWAEVAAILPAYKNYIVELREFEKHTTISTSYLDQYAHLISSSTTL